MKLKTLRMARLTLDDESEKLLTFLGRGLSHDAWRDGRWVYLISRPVKGCEDYSREVFTSPMAGLGRSTHYPKLTYLGEMGRDRRVYKMPYYEPLLSKHTLAYEQFKFLHHHMEVIRSSKGIGHRTVRINELGYDMMKEMAKLTKKTYPKLGSALDRLADAAANWGTHYTFEFNRSNLSVDCGILILRDVLYNIKCCEARWKL
jgi:hypothetical protein